MASASVKKYECECREEFDEDTGASEGVIQCIGCAADSGYCECTCDCGQCIYTDTPCDFKPPEEPCELCLIRKDWEQAEAAKAAAEDPLSDVSPIISEVELKISQIKGDLNTAHVPGMLSHENLRLKLGRLETCLPALKMVKDKSAWASSLIDEVKNVLSLDGRKGLRKYCGIPNCGCHLRILNGILCEKAGDEFKRLDAQLVSAEDLMHLTQSGVAKSLDALDSAKFQKRIADEIYEEFVWDREGDPGSGTFEQQEELRQELKQKQAAENEAENIYTAMRGYFTAACNSYRLLQTENGLGPN